MRHIPVVILLCVLLLIGCSTRQVDETSAYSAPSASSAIDINTATANELEKLPHIGQKTAEAIIAFREENGPFRRVEHLMLIKGVSEKRFAELRQYLRAE